MKTIIFECEIVTPMFLYGESQESPELRPPSIKGLIRIWWRLIYQDMLIKPKNAQDMLNEESRIFGGKLIEEVNGKSKDVSYKSKFNIHVTTDAKTDIIGKNSTSNLSDGIKYLWYSLINPTKKKYLMETSKFTVTITSKYSDVLEKVSNSFIYLSIFGALGSRSRRGAGNFKINSITNPEPDKIKLKEFNLSECNSKDKLLEKLESFKLKKFVKQILVFEPTNNWGNALSIIGEPFKIFKSPFEIKANKRIPQLIFKLIKTKDKSYFPIIIWFKGNSDPDIKGERPQNMISDFIKILKNHVSKGF